ncbi:hypothetical protein ABZX93_18715 [Streptomyces sp. NPDC006632]|uniref:hypothetical protein n=1 Tax=Streptomyces sp. NPDC006632 TaxID=3157182 RepID=UPI0033B9A4EA
MSDVTFELRSYWTKTHLGIAGPAGPFGEVSTRESRPRLRSKLQLPYQGVELLGDAMPEAAYRSPGTKTECTPDSTLTVDGVAAEFDFNRRALRNTSRALHIAWGERRYTYTVLRVFRSFALERDGVRVAFQERTEGKERVHAGSVTGAADAVDLAIAVLFQRVDTSALTSVGAVSMALDAVFSRGSGEPVDCSD